MVLKGRDRPSSFPFLPSAGQNEDVVVSCLGLANTDNMLETVEPCAMFRKELIPQGLLEQSHISSQSFA